LLDISWKNPWKDSNATREKGYKTLIVDHFFEKHVFFQKQGEIPIKRCVLMNTVYL